MTTKDDLSRMDSLTLTETPQPASANEKASTHTPGPWVIWENTPGDGRWCIGSGSEKDRSSKLVVAPDDGWETGYKDHREREANAHLIAAAPTMLDALKAHDAYLSQHYSGPDSDALSIDAAKAWALTRAAIKKADGQ
jgi:hypothetical protein